MLIKIWFLSRSEKVQRVNVGVFYVEVIRNVYLHLLLCELTVGLKFHPSKLDSNVSFVYLGVKLVS